MTAQAATSGLRFDKVATRLVERLQANLSEAVPDGMAVAVTITAPIRLPARTAAAIEERVRTVLDRRSTGRDEQLTVHGNRVLIRLLRTRARRAPNVIGYVHNPEVDPRQLLAASAGAAATRDAVGPRRARRPKWP